MRKKRLHDLALFGGKPAFSESLHVTKPNRLGEARFKELIVDVFESGWYTNNGALVQELERKLETFLQVNNCILTCNGTQAMAIALHAFGLKGEVILPSYTFVSTAHCLLLNGLKPVFCDIDKDSLSLDLDLCESLITPETSAIIPTHIWGRVNNVSEIEDFCKKHNLRLIFDAAHAFGTSEREQMVGSFGEAEVFSFHSTKTFQTFEGGAVTTNDSKIASKLRSLRNFGFIDYDVVGGIGTNAKMSEINAAMGLANLEVFPQILSKNKTVYETYRRQISEIDGIDFLDFPESNSPNYHYIVVLIDEEKLGMTRDDILQILHRENVVARKYFYPGCHRMPPHSQSDCVLSLPVTESVCSKVLVLPGGATLTVSDVEKVSDILRFVVDNSDMITVKYEKES